jgi:aldehyde dehydrogenase (NAD+)
MGAAVEMEPLVIEARTVDASGAAREAQARWSETPIAQRLAVLRRARHLLAERVGLLCAAISGELARTPADTRVAEVLPLLDACRYLEREAAKILATRKLGRRGRPVWLAGVESEIQRVPYGQVLVIGPGNYPLLLPGVQTLQALAAGNAVVWKPGRGGRAVAEVFAAAMVEAGLARDLLTVTDESVVAANEALAGRVNGVAPGKVVFTGSAEAGRDVLHELSKTATPCVVELSGCDAVVALPSADLTRLAQAIAFGMRLNGSATCMAPRRLVLVGASAERKAESIERLAAAMSGIGGVRLSEATARRLDWLLDEAVEQGAQVVGERAGLQRPLLVTDVRAEMEIARADVFAPVLMLLNAETGNEAVAAVEACPYGLTASIFGEEREARAMAARLTVGTVVINDVMVPTADPRVPFGGRKGSGFGTTRGAQGLLEMTAAKTVAARRGKGMRHYDATSVEHEGLFDGLILTLHAGTWAERWSGMKRIVAAARVMGRDK